MKKTISVLIRPMPMFRKKTVDNCSLVTSFSLIIALDNPNSMTISNIALSTNAMEIRPKSVGDKRRARTSETMKFRS